MRVAEIRDALERCVDERTVFRDVKDLEQAGFPLVSEEGRWRMLRPNGAPYVAPLQASELVALALAAEALTPYAGTPVVEALSGLHGKLGAMLTPRGRQFVEHFRDAHVATYTLPGDSEVISEAALRVDEALQKQQVLRLRYHSPHSGVTEREFDPYTHWCFEGRAYVIGHCHLRQAIRVFLLARIEHAEITDASFDVDPNFDPRQCVKGGFGVWIGESHAVELLFAPEAAHLVRERCFHAGQKVTQEGDGWVRLEMEVAGLPALARWLAGSGGAVRALRPRMLADMVSELHTAGLQAAAVKPPVRAGVADQGSRRPTALEE